MKQGQRILIAAGCIVLLAVSWLLAVTAKSDDQKQAELLNAAQPYLEDEVYIKAIPILEEAASYEGKRTLEAEETLKSAYLALGSGYRDSYETRLDLQMSREDCAPDIFREAAQHYMSMGELSEALAILRDGADKTGDAELRDLYEKNRYVYSLSDTTYEDLTVVSGGGLQVRKEGKWGLANAKGSLIIPCIYDKVSTYYNGQVIVKKGQVISAVNTSNYRTALLHEDASDFGNYGQGRVALLFSDGWHQADGEFRISATSYEELGTYSNGYAAAKKEGRWGVINGSEEWVIAPEYDDVIQDPLGRCCGQGMVFARRGNDVIQLSVEDGKQVGEPYQDAKPFADGWAAVKRGDLWGFVDVSGQTMIPFQFQDAQSFSQHLGAVQVEEDWGYVSLLGNVVIEPQFKEARGFYNGTAAVRVGDLWCFISLEEYDSGSEVSF